MKKNEWKQFVKWTISATLILSIVTPAFSASNILKQIYVDKKPIKIVIDGEDTTLPSNTPAMI